MLLLLLTLKKYNSSVMVIIQNVILVLFLFLFTKNLMIDTVYIDIKYKLPVIFFIKNYFNI